MKIDIKNFNLAMANSQLSIKELSKLSGISTVTISNIRKQKTLPEPKTVGKIAEALNVKVEDLIVDEG